MEKKPREKVGWGTPRFTVKSTGKASLGKGAVGREQQRARRRTPRGGHPHPFTHVPTSHRRGAEWAPQRPRGL